MIFLSRAVIAVLVMGASAAWAETLSLEQAVTQAIAQDPWLTASNQKQAAAHAMSNGAAVLPDPKFSMGLMNFPTDTFDYGQEAMTQVLVGVSQVLPRGDSLDLQSQRFRQQGALMPLQREQRRAQVRLTVSQLWLDALKASRSIQLIEDNRVLFKQLADIVGSSYSSAFGPARQQDLVRAQLELDQLDDRLVQLQLQQVTAEQQLSEWLHPQTSDGFELAPDLPELTVQHRSPASSPMQQFALHPSIRSFDQAIAMAETDVSLAKQKYEAEWMVNASYGFRGEDAMGRDRADLFSIGVSVDVPIFSSKRQDAQVQAETYELESIRTERLLALRNMMARYQTLNAEIGRLDQRLALYDERLLPGLNHSAEAAISAYTANDGNFSEVIQARISELNAKLAQLNIGLERSKKVAELNYLLTARTEGDAL